VSQRWLRELLWDHLADALRSPKRPRSKSPLDQLRRACIELSAFLEIDAPGGGHDPTLLREEHMRGSWPTNSTGSIRASPPWP
jgi:hypothetical protein